MPTDEQILSWRPERKWGYILKVDLEYPEELRDAHNAYPLAPEKVRVPRVNMSPYQRALLAGQPEDRTEKLFSTLRDKEKYVLHYRNL